MNIKISEVDKIDIEDISDNIKYEHLALLVDREDFLLHVKSVRKSLGITNLLQHEQVDKWLHREYKNSSIQHMDKEDKEIFDQSFCLSQSVAELKDKFHKNVNYTNAIRYAILAGKITDKEFKISAFCAEYPFSQEFENAELTAEWPMIAIFVTPETKIDELKPLFDSEVIEKFKKIDKKVKFISKRSPTFKEARKWFWMKLGFTFDDFFEKYEDDNDRLEGDSYDAVKRSVERYAKKLRRDI